MIADGMKNGEILRGPALEQRLVLALDGREPADARRDEHADARRDSSGVIVRPASSIANCDAAIAYWMKMSIFLTSFFSMNAQRVEVLDFARDARRELRRVELGDRRRCRSGRP